MVAYIGQYFIFDTHGEDSDYNKYSGQKVKVLRALTESEADLMDTGMMYEVQLPDGQVIDAFEDELEPIQGITASSYVSAAVARYSEKFDGFRYDTIVPVIFHAGYQDFDGYLLTGADVPEELEVDLTGLMCFNDLPITVRTTEPAIKVSSLSAVLAWLGAHDISSYTLDDYGLVVGGGEDGRISALLHFAWIEELKEK